MKKGPGAVDEETAAKVEEAATFQETSLLGPAMPWAQVDARFHPEAIRDQLALLARSCGGDVGLIDLDCEEYPCISWSIPSTGACRPRGTQLGFMHMGPDALTPGMQFAVHASADDATVLQTRIDWRVSRRRQEYDDDPQLATAPDEIR
jgi:hypothetical protein